MIISNNRKYYTIAVILWISALFSATFLPGTDLPEISFKLNDKLIHVIMYLVLSILFLNASWKEKFLKIPKKRIVMTVLMSVGFIAVITEIIQGFIPGRNTSLYDTIANLIGVVIGFLVFLIMRKK